MASLLNDPISLKEGLPFITLQQWIESVDFTREPIVETIITPKEGCKLVVRASKGNGQEEFFVDSLEVVSFGSALFFRSQDKPKSFLLPVSDYEVLEVREARLVLKNVGVDRNIKIGGGRDGTFKPPREPQQPKLPPEPVAKAPVEVQPEEGQPEGAEPSTEPRLEKKRERRRGYRRRRGRDEQGKELPAGEAIPEAENALAEAMGESPLVAENLASRITEAGNDIPVTFSNLLAPPPTLISETLSKYRENALFKNAFYSREEKDDDNGNEPLLPEHIPVDESTIELCPEENLREELPHVEEVFASELTAEETQVDHPQPIEEESPYIETVHHEEHSEKHPQDEEHHEKHSKEESHHKIEEGELWNFSEELSDKKLDD